MLDRLWPVLLLGVVVRAVVLWRLPEVHYDEAVNGLMARHVLQGEFPIFYWGQDYAGTLAAFLIAVPFRLFDSSVLTLHLVPFGFSLLLMLLSYRLARVVWDEDTARLAALYAAVPPLTLLRFGVTAKDPYSEIPVIGVVLLLLTIGLAGGQGVSGRRALVLGIVAGVAWWTQLLLVSYLLAAALFLLLRRRWAWLLPEGAVALAGFLLGSAPFWLYGLTEPGESLGIIRSASLEQMQGNLVHALRRALPVLLGASAPWPAPAANRLVLLLMGFVYLPACGLWLYDRLRRPRARGAADAGALLLLTAAAALAVYVASPYASDGGAKYLFPLYGVLPALLAHYTLAVKRRAGVGAGLVLGLLILGLHTQEIARDVLDSFRPGYLEQQYRPPTRALIDFLATRGITRVYGHFTLSLKLTFDTREEIIATDWYGFRNAGYLEEVGRAERVALVAQKVLKLPDPDTLEENLRALGGGFRRQDVGGFVVFYDFLPPPPSRPIPSRDWAGRGAPRAEGSGQAYDRDGATWWGSGEPQRPGLAYELDLGRVHRLTALSLHPGPVLDGAPRGYAVEVSADGRHWRDVVRVAEVLRGLHWVGAQPRLDRSGRISTGFPPVQARYIRVTQTGRDHHFWWSIGEIFASEERSLAADGSPGRAALEEGRRLEALAGWEHVGASPLALSSWRARRGVDWDAVLGAYARAIRADPELEEAHHRLAVVLLRLDIPPPGDPDRVLALERVGAWRMAAEESESALRRSPGGAARSSGWEARLRAARMAGERDRAREIEELLRARFTPPIPSGVAFGRQLRFLGLGVEPRQVPPGGTVHVSAYWQALGPLREGYQASFTFHGPAGARFAAEPLPVGVPVPPGQWLPGETVRDDLTIEVPPGSAPGRYDVHLRVQGSDARRLRVWRFGFPTWSREVRLGVVEVKGG